jgi:protein gp37
MADKSRIEWTDATWNPVRGCSHVSEGCRNCYAERMAARFCGDGDPYKGTIEGGKWNGKLRFDEDALKAPLRWRRPRRIFVCSMSDLFHPEVPFEFIDNVFAVMAAASQHTFQVLTKRPGRMAAYFARSGVWGKVQDAMFEYCDPPREVDVWPPRNVWLGVSVENQKAADERIPQLLETPAAARFVSCEPLLGPVDLLELPRPFEFHQSPYGWKEWLPRKLHWVIVGGESGPSARPMHPDWARGLRDQCQAAGVPFFFKGWGEWSRDCMHDSKTCRFVKRPEPGKLGCMFRCGKKRAGRLLDGRTWDEFPK